MASCVHEKQIFNTELAMTEQNKSERNLKEIFRKMNADRAQEIREAYYKAVEGLSVLAETLEIADAEMGSPHDLALIEEHLIACQAVDAMKKSLLGRIL